MLSWQGVLVEQERYKDLLRQAEKERLASRVLPSRLKGERMPRWLLLSLLSLWR
jgi:hypothetical protein